MGTQGHSPPRLPPMPGTLGPSRCCVSCLFSSWYVSNCVSLMIGSCAENNKNPIPLLLLWKTGTEKTWGRLFIRKATSASMEGGGQGAERGRGSQEHHRGHQVGLEDDPGGVTPRPASFRAGLSCGLNCAGGFRGPVFLGDCPRQLLSEVARRGYSVS